MSIFCCKPFSVKLYRLTLLIHIIICTSYIKRQCVIYSICISVGTTNSLSVHCWVSPKISVLNKREKKDMLEHKFIYLTKLLPLKWTAQQGNYIGYRLLINTWFSWTIHSSDWTFCMFALTKMYVRLRDIEQHMSGGEVVEWLLWSS